MRKPGEGGAAGALRARAEVGLVWRSGEALECVRSHKAVVP